MTAALHFGTNFVSTCRHVTLEVVALSGFNELLITSPHAPKSGKYKHAIYFTRSFSDLRTIRHKTYGNGHILKAVMLALKTEIKTILQPDSLRHIKLHIPLAWFNFRAPINQRFYRKEPSARLNSLNLPNYVLFNIHL